MTHGGDDNLPCANLPERALLHRKGTGAQWIRLPSTHKSISVALDLSVGHIADMTIEADGRRLKPLHRAPWIEEPQEPLPQGLPDGTVRLSGDFLCAPFSRSDVEEAPLHGWPANSGWDHDRQRRRARRLARPSFGCGTRSWAPTSTRS